MAWARRGALHQREMPTGGGSRHSEPLRIHIILRGVGANKPHGPMHVLASLGNGEPRLTAVNHREHRVSTVYKLQRKKRDDGFLGRNPSSRDADYDPSPV